MLFLFAIQWNYLIKRRKQRVESPLDSRHISQVLLHFASMTYGLNYKGLSKKQPSTMIFSFHGKRLSSGGGIINLTPKVKESFWKSFFSGSLEYTNSNPLN